MLIEGQSLRRTRLLPKSQPRGAGALIHSFLEKSEPEAARIGDLTHSTQQRGHLQKHIPRARLSCRVKVFVAFFPPLPSVFAAPSRLSPSCMPWLRRFSTWVRGQLPSAIPLHPFPLLNPVLHGLSGIHPSPSHACSACAPPRTISTPISTIAVMISTITNPVTTVNATESCHLNKAPR